MENGKCLLPDLQISPRSFKFLTQFLTPSSKTAATLRPPFPSTTRHTDPKAVFFPGSPRKRKPRRRGQSPADPPQDIQERTSLLRSRVHSSRLLRRLVQKHRPGVSLQTTQHRAAPAHHSQDMLQRVARDGRISNRAWQPIHRTRQMLPCSSITSREPAFWCKPSMF